ncbi:hypothetical protein OIU76_028446 [Salix suchowensis]|nr:hypothetical protein OIU76_028446 [Salix suchowensis]
MIRGTDGRFKVVSWHDAFAVVAEIAHQVKLEEIVGIAESMMALKDFLNKMGSNNVWCEGNGPSPNADLRSGYIMNCGINGLENADVFLLVGAQPRVEAAMVNARIRETVRGSNAKVAYVEGRHPFCSTLSNAKNPAIIVGAGLLERSDKDAIFSAAETIVKNGNVVRPYWNGFNVLLLNAAQAAALDLGPVPESIQSIKSAKFVYLMGADDECGFGKASK